MPKVQRILHLNALQKFVNRLATDLTPEERTRLESVIATYVRLYVP